MKCREYLKYGALVQVYSGSDGSFYYSDSKEEV